MNVQTPRHGEIGELTGLRRREAKRIDVEGARWLCAQVAFGYSFAVADDLTAAGYRGYAPHGVKVCRARLLGGKRSFVERDYPVFGRYLFVGVPAGLLFGHDCHRRITGVLGDQRGFQAVPKKAIAALNEAELAGAWVESLRPARPDWLKRGAAVRVTHPAFQGLEAVVEDLPAELRAVIRMGVSQLRVTVGADALEPA